VFIKKLPIDWVSSHAEVLALYTRSLPVVVLKNKSPPSRLLEGFDEPTLYLSLKSLISPLRLTRSLSGSVAL
jgi:hypothetical protein